MEQEIQRSEIGKFEALHLSLDEIAEMALDAFGGQFLDKYRVKAGLPSDHPDVAGVALVAGAGVGETGERLGHFSQSPPPASLSLRGGLRRTSRRRFRARPGGPRRSRL